MTTYFEYGVTLSDNQKNSLVKAINSKSPITLRIKNSNLKGNDELMLTKTQLKRIKKSLENGTGADIKISKTRISKIAKNGGNLFSSLASLGAKLLPFAVKGLSKAVPALATGAVSALGSLGVNKLLGSGMHIPNEFFPMLPQEASIFTPKQIDMIDKAFSNGSKLVIKPTKKQINGGFSGTLASIGIPMAIELVSKMFGSGLQVDKVPPPPPPNPYMNVHLPQSGGKFPMYPPPFYGNWNETIGMGKTKKKGKKKTAKKKNSGEGLLLGKNSPFNAIPILGSIL